jgi:hypothetical protein
MDAYTCPKGHQSTEADFCSECGAKIQGASAAPAPPAPAATGSPTSSGDVCPDCATPRAADGGNFCELCGYNFATGAHGEVAVTVAPAAQPAPPGALPIASSPVPPIDEPAATTPAAPVTGWTVVVAVDPTLREAGSPDPPPGIGPFAIDLSKPSTLIGRKSDSRAIFPEIPLNYDDAVSHRHALLLRADDGTLALRDIGAANGTRLNAKDVEPMVDTPLKDGDQITLGHWTRIAVKAVY